MIDSDWCVVILAAGKGTRMKSDLPKVLHKVADKPMIIRVCEASKTVTDNIIIVVGHKLETVKKTVSSEFDLNFAIQKEQKGTGDALKAAVPILVGSKAKYIMVLCGDTPLIQGKTLVKFTKEHENSGASISILAMEVDDPKGYGRLVTDLEKNVKKIVEESDATEDEKQIKLVNSGIYCFNRNFLLKGLQNLESINSQSEYYLTDLAGFAAKDSDEKACFKILENREEAMGVNSPEELIKAESLVLRKLSVA